MHEISLAALAKNATMRESEFMGMKRYDRRTFIALAASVVAAPLVLRTGWYSLCDMDEASLIGALPPAVVKTAKAMRHKLRRNADAEASVAPLLASGSCPAARLMPTIRHAMQEDILRARQEEIDGWIIPASAAELARFIAARSK